MTDDYTEDEFETTLEIIRDVRDKFHETHAEWESLDDAEWLVSEERDMQHGGE